MDTETGTCCSAVTDTNILGSEQKYEKGIKFQNMHRE